MKLIIVVAFVGMAWASPPLYNIQEQGDMIPDNSLDNKNYIDPDAIAVDIVSNDFEPFAVHDLPELIEVADYLREETRKHSDLEKDDADKVFLANNDEILDTDKILDTAPLSYDGDDARQYNVIKIADAPLEAIPDEKSLNQLHIVDLDNINDDSIQYAGIMQIAPSELDSLRVEFDDDMERELFDNLDNDAPQLPRRIIFSDPNLR